MDLTNVPSGTPASVVQTLENHLSVADSFLARDKRLLPMLMTQGSRKKDNNLFQLRPQRGNDDEHKLLKAATSVLRDIDYEIALLSYSTQIMQNGSAPSDALKTYIFDKNGQTFVFYTLYEIKGFLKKKVTFQKSMFAERFKTFDPQ